MNAMTLFSAIEEYERNKEYGEQTSLDTGMMRENYMVPVALFSYELKINV